VEKVCVMAVSSGILASGMHSNTSGINYKTTVMSWVDTHKGNGLGLDAEGHELILIKEMDCLDFF
jgi:hypothetical protein